MWAIASLTIFTCGVSHLQGNAHWRYSGDSLSDRIAADGGGILVATALLQATGPLIGWWLMFMRPALLVDKSWTSIATRSLAALAALSSINGLNSAIWALSSTIFMLWPRQCDGLMFWRRETRRPRGVLGALAGTAILAVAFAILGMIAKTGRSSEELWHNHVASDFLVQRHAVHFQHAMGALEIGIDQADDHHAFAFRRRIDLQSAAYRIGVVTGSTNWVERPDPSTLSRWTAEQFANYDLSNNPRVGSSPGTVGTFALLLPPPWSYLALSIFSFLLVFAINWYLAGCARLSHVACAAAAFIPIRIITDTPVNIVNPTSVPFALVVVAVLGRCVCASSLLPVRGRYQSSPDQRAPLV
jgi:hypothetical protein